MEPIAIKPLREHSKMPTGQTILIVEDDISLCKFLVRELASKHYSVEVSHDGETACVNIQESICDLIILDLNLPKMDGMAVLRHIRLSRKRLPILVLTARNRTADLISALDQGADDCLFKPFSLLELLARVQCLLRRNIAPAPSSPKGCGLTINREEHWVLRGKRRIHLTVREFDLLEYLMNNAGKTVSREALMRDVWNIPFDSTTNILEVYMKYLRDKVDLSGETKLIRTVRGVGYVFSND
jgi:two-component system copper resistance phosphate regulon response regulator CusR